MIAALLKRIGPESVKQTIWNKELQTKFLPTGRQHTIMVSLIAKYLNGGSVLDLGCGHGSMVDELLNANVEFTSFVGVDISDMAVSGANARHTDNTRVSFIAASIEAFEPTDTYNVIYFKDSLYYVPFTRIIPVLQRYSRHREPDGVFIVRIAQGDRFHRIIKTIHRHFAVIEDRAKPPVEFLVFH